MTPIPFHQKMCTRTLNFEFEKLNSTQGVVSAHLATANLHWLSTKSSDFSVRKILSNLLSSKAKQEKEDSQISLEAFWKYYKQGEPRKSDYQADLIQICQI